MTALGYTTIAEDVTSHGQIDLTILLDNKIIVFEFKLIKNGDAKTALEQIKHKNYATKYLSYNKDIYLVGMSFDTESRNVHDCIYEVY